MATKPGRVVAYNEDLHSTKSHDPFITRSSHLISLIGFLGLQHKLLSRRRLLVPNEIDYFKGANSCQTSVNVMI